ncbi:MAG: flippase [Duncaniella sp.]|nr:flippase [Duncaniella sp.]
MFPIITFPYAARVLLPEGIGTFNFLNSIIGYIILLTSLGVPMYAVREVSRHRSDKVHRDKITIEIILLCALLCLMGYVAVWLLAEYVPEIHSNARLFYVLSLAIVFNSIGVDWFYQAIEDFKFITIRAIIIRTLSAISLYIFVHSADDLLIYGFINLGTTVGNNLINFIHLRHHVSFRSFRLSELRVLRHLPPALHVFILNLIISLYIQLNTIMLGFMSGEESVGYFTAGTKISHMALTFITSIGLVIFPRCANLLHEGKLEEFSNIINKVLSLYLGLSIPVTVGLIILATPLTMVFCGEEYTASIQVLIINAPVIIFICLTGIMGIQVLFPMDKTNLVILSVTGAAVANIAFNYLLIPSLGATGAAWATLIAEGMVFVMQLILGYKYYPFKLSRLFQWRYVVGAIVMGGGVYAATLPFSNNIVRLSVGISAGVIVYYLFLYLTHDPMLEFVIATVKNKFNRHQSVS